MNCSAARPAEQQMQQSTWTGSFHLLWGDPPPLGRSASSGAIRRHPGRDQPATRYQLVTDRSEVVSLFVADSLPAEFGGPRGLTGKRVTVVGEPAEQGTGAIRVPSIRLDPVRP
jgi:hypothetical protein